ncbi:MAG: hypothetical protein LVQ63_00585 [Thermoplasmatales archaeon]|nr:hypothetical protein [Thermoplasmatales archaeon]
MEKNRRNILLFLGFLLVGLAYAFIGIIAAHPFDDAIYAFNSQMFYYLHGSPFLYLSQGIFLDAINVAGYFPIALLSLFLRSNVLFIQSGVKIPFILFTFLSSWVLYKIAKQLKFNEIYAALLFLTSPIYFFTSVIYGSAIVVSVFFLLVSIYLALTRKYLLTAIMYGISAGMYLYPVFGIPIVARYIMVNGKKRDAVMFLAVSSLFAALGQLVILFFFIQRGQIGISPNSPSGYLSPYSSPPYYDIFDFLSVFGKGGIVPGQLYNILYYGSSIVFSLSYLFVRKRNVNAETLIIFLLIQGVLFAALAPYNLPSYMAAMIPLAIIASLMLKRWIYIGLMWVSSLFSFIVMQTITHVGFIVYFSGLNMKILTTNIYPYSTFPSWTNSIAGTLYVASLLLFIPLSLLRKEGNMARLRKSLIAQSATIGAIVLVGVVLLAPVASSIPQNMYLSPSIDSFTAHGSNEYIVGTSLVATYYFPDLGSMDQAGINHFLGKIEFPSNYYGIYTLSGDSAVKSGNFMQAFSLPYPLLNAKMQLMGTSPGEVSLIIENSTSSISLQESQSQSGDSTVFSFNAGPYISGKYLMIVNSSAPLQLHNSTSLALSITGIPTFGSATIDDKVISNGTVEPDQLGGTVIIRYSGPFYGIPDELPVLTVQMVKPLGKPDDSQLAIGGIAFAGLIVLPPSLLVFLRYRRPREGPRGQRER